MSSLAENRTGRPAASADSLSYPSPYSSHAAALEEFGDAADHGKIATAMATVPKSIKKVCRGQSWDPSSVC